ncbi:MAG: Bax inhibitor-1/YccA family protein [Isosphaeraceae bacterium]
MATSNPAFSKDIFAGWEQVYGAPRSLVTTVQGTMAKTFLLLGIMSATALWAWNAVASDQLQLGVLPVAGIAGFVLSLITIFKPTLAPWTSPVYAAMQGVFLGALSQVIEMRAPQIYRGIALQAVMLTVGTLMVMLFLYGSRVIRVTERLRAGIIMATGALCLFYLASIVLRLFGVQIPFLFSATPLGIGFSLFVVGLAAFNLLLDFDFIEEASARQAPKYMEWYGAFGLILTLVWLYLEMLRLLQKVANSRD